MEFRERAARLAAGLKSLGIAPGDRVAILALNSDRYLEYYVAVPWAGAVVVPLNTRWSEAELTYALNDSGATCLLLDDAFLKHAAVLLGQVASLRRAVYLSEQSTPPGLVGYEALIDGNAPLADAGCGGEDMAGIFYTGGTTGFSKGVMLSHRSLWASAMAWLVEAEPLPQSVGLHAGPMFHLADVGAIVGLLPTNAVIPFFTPEGVLAAIERFRVTDLLLVPTMINMLVSHPKIAETDVSSIRRLAYGGSVIPKRYWRARSPRSRIAASPKRMARPSCRRSRRCCSPNTTCSRARMRGGSPRRDARPPATRWRSSIRTMSRCPAVRSARSAVAARTRCSATGTSRRRTAAALRDGWVYTGDAGYMDDEGFVFIVDRLKDMIVSGGENVFSAEVENAVFNHSAVAQCAVVAIPSAEWGEAVHAIVILKEGCAATAEEIIAHCRREIAHYKCPRSVEFRAEPFPLSGAGKVLKRELRAPYWERQTRQVS